MANGLTYWDYLKLDRLLDLQGGVEGDEAQQSPDELHFIIVHQVYELWFKLILREMREARDNLAAEKVAEKTIPWVVHHLRRVNAILTLAVDQWRVVETLTPQDFLAFRDKLVPASGFQSFQMRELEIVMGLEEAQRILYGKVHPLDHIEKLGRDSTAGDLARERIRAARGEQSILEALNEWLYRTPIQGSSPSDPHDDAVVRAFLNSYIEAASGSHSQALERLVDALGDDAREELEAKFERTVDAARSFLFAEDVDEDDRDRIRRCRAAVLFIESYRELPLLAWPRVLLDSLVELEEGVVKFRHGHVRMVERVIGRRVGTGGSGGVSYLEKTGSYRVFRDLWAVRTVLLPRDKCPPLSNRSFYDFVAR